MHVSTPLALGNSFEESGIWAFSKVISLSCSHRAGFHRFPMLDSLLGSFRVRVVARQRLDPTWKVLVSHGPARLGQRFNPEPLDHGPECSDWQSAVGCIDCWLLVGASG